MRLLILLAILGAASANSCYFPGYGCQRYCGYCHPCYASDSAHFPCYSQLHCTPTRGGLVCRPRSESCWVCRPTSRGWVCRPKCEGWMCGPSSAEWMCKPTRSGDWVCRPASEGRTCKPTASGNWICSPTSNGWVCRPSSDVWGCRPTYGGCVCNPTPYEWQCRPHHSSYASPYDYDCHSICCPTRYHPHCVTDPYHPIHHSTNRGYSKLGNEVYNQLFDCHHSCFHC